MERKDGRYKTWDHSNIFLKRYLVHGHRCHVRLIGLEQEACSQNNEGDVCEPRAALRWKSFMCVMDRHSALWVARRAFWAPNVAISAGPRGRVYRLCEEISLMCDGVFFFFLPPAASERPANNSSCYSMCGRSAAVLLFILGVAADIQNRPQNPACFTVRIDFLSGALSGFKCSV